MAFLDCLRIASNYARLACKPQVTRVSFCMPRHPRSAPTRARKTTSRRSGCPIATSLDIFGDRWSLLVIRDLMFKGLHSFKEFAEAGEGIATNVLAERLARLEAAAI